MRQRNVFRWAGLLAALVIASGAHAQQFLKQSTAAQAIKLCGFVDSTDGNTEETGLSIANTDIKIAKAGGSFGNKNSGGGTYDAAGCYTATLDATDTNTVGRLDIAVHMSGALPVYARYQVLEEAVYDELIGASALGYIANAPVNVAQFGGTNGTFSGGVPAVNTTQLNGTAQTARDIGASVLLSSGTGTGQVSLSSGAVTVGTNNDKTGYTASSVGTGAITTGSFASGAINAAAIATDAIGAAEIASDVSTELLSGLSGLSVNATQISGDSGAADALEAAFDGTAGAVSPLGIARQGTAQSATSTTLVLDSPASFANDVPIGMTLVACGSTQGYCQSRAVTDYVGGTDTATVDAWTVTPSGTITYYLFATAPGSGSGGSLTASDVWSYATRTLTALDEDDTTIDLNGTAVGSVTGNVGGNVTGSVGSVTGNVGGTVNGLTSTAQGHVRTALGLSSANLDTQLGTIDANVDSILDDTGTTGVVVASGSKTGYALSATGVDVIWDEDQSGHTTEGTFGAFLDSSVSGVSTGGVSASEIAEAVADQALSGHTSSGSVGEALDTIASLDTKLGTPAGASIAADIATVGGFVDTEVAAVKAVTDKIDTALELDGSVYRFTSNALENAPVGEGGGAADWTTGEKEQIRYRLGMDGDATEPSSATPSLATAGALLSLANEVGTDGAGLTAVPWNSAWAASMRSALGLGSANLDAQIAGLSTLTTDQIRDAVSEDQGGGVTRGCIEAVLLAYAAGDTTTTGGTTTYKDPSNGETRITGTVTSNGNRSATITCPAY